MIEPPDVLVTQRLRLEPWHERWRSEWRGICRDPEVMRYVGRGVIWSASEADDVFASAIQHWATHGFGWRAALRRSDDVWLGFVGLNCVGTGTAGVSADEVEIGWWFVRSVWGQGLASEGAAAVLEECFGRLALRRIIARVQPANIASNRVASKIGMRLKRRTTGRHGELLNIYSCPAPKLARAPAHIELVTSIEPARLSELMDLYRSEWWTATRTQDDVTQMLQSSDLVFGLIDLSADQLVGFARVLTDRTYLAVLLDVIVAADSRREGLGSMLMTAILEHPALAAVQSIELVCQPELIPFYRRFGFTEQVAARR